MPSLNRLSAATNQDFASQSIMKSKYSSWDSHWSISDIRLAINPQDNQSNTNAEPKECGDADKPQTRDPSSDFPPDVADSSAYDADNYTVFPTCGGFSESQFAGAKGFQVPTYSDQ